MTVTQECLEVQVWTIPVQAAAGAIPLVGSAQQHPEKLLDSVLMVGRLVAESTAE